MKKKTEIESTTNPLIKIEQRTLRYTSRVASSSRVRKKGKFESAYVDNSGYGVKINANETINIDDIINLIILIADYIHNETEYTYAGKINDKEVLNRTIKLSDICKEKGITTHKHNRLTILESILRLMDMKIWIIEKEEITITKYIFEIQIDVSLDKIRITVNKRFFETNRDKGLIINYKDILLYDNIKDKILTHYKNYAKKLHLYLQSQKVKVKHKKGLSYYYKAKLTYDEIFNVTGISENYKNERDRKKAVERTLKLIHLANMPLYVEKNNGIYVRENFTILPNQKAITK